METAITIHVFTLVLQLIESLRTSVVQAQAEQQTARQRVVCRVPTTNKERKQGKGKYHRIIRQSGNKKAGKKVNFKRQ